MKDRKKEIKFKGIKNDLIRTCPVCGFSFRAFDPKTKKKVSICPMCGHKFRDPNIYPDKNDSFNKRYF